jgi:tol-pal system protein YbgF
VPFLRVLGASCALGAAACGATGGSTTQAPVDARAAQASPDPLVRLQATSDEQSARIAELETRLALVEAEARGWRSQVPTAPKPVETVRIGEQRREPAAPRERVPLVQLHESERSAPADVGPYVLPTAPAGMSTRLPVVPLPEERSAKLGTLPAPGGPPLDDAALRAGYRAALRALQDRRYDEAQSGLASLLTAHPEHPLAEGATYWMGEVHYAQRRYGEALRQFESLLALHAKSSKRADAMVKAGMCLRRLGDDERAKRYFEQVRQQFPSSEAARMASREGAS